MGSAAPAESATPGTAAGGPCYIERQRPVAITRVCDFLTPMDVSCLMQTSSKLKSSCRFAAVACKKESVASVHRRDKLVVSYSEGGCDWTHPTHTRGWSAKVYLDSGPLPVVPSRLSLRMTVSDQGWGNTGFSYAAVAVMSAPLGTEDAWATAAGTDTAAGGGGGSAGGSGGGSAGGSGGGSAGGSGDGSAGGSGGGADSEEKPPLVGEVKFNQRIITALHERQDVVLEWARGRAVVTVAGRGSPDCFDLPISAGDRVLGVIVSAPYPGYSAIALQGDIDVRFRRV